MSAALFLGGAVLACGNLGLSGGVQNDVGSGATPPGTHDVEGGAEASAADGPTMVADAGVTAPSPTNPLCNVSPDDAAVPCDPDWSASPNGDACAVPDSGAPDSAYDNDGGIELACHVVKQKGGAAQACSIGGTGIDGASCETGADCAPAFECVGMPGRCRHYCCHGDKSCDQSAAKAFCDIQAMAQTGLEVPVCSPVNPCDLFASPSLCSPDETCSVVKDDGTVSCVSIGTQLVGQPCDDAHCAGGLTCLGKPGSRECYKLCRIDYAGDCPFDTKCKGSAQLFKDPQYGICQ